MENFFANQYGQVMAIDTDSDYVIIKSRIHEDDCGYPGWGHPVIDADKKIFLPRYFHVQVLKCNPITQKYVWFWIPTITGACLWKSVVSLYFGNW